MGDKTIKGFVERYNRRAGDGIRGCWSERIMSLISEIEGWNNEELVKYTIIHEKEWEMARREFLEICRDQ